MFKKTAQLVRDGFPNGGERGRGRSTEPVALKDTGHSGRSGEWVVFINGKRVLWNRESL